MNLGGAIQMCRIRRGLSQSRLAELAGCSTSYLSMLENGKKSDPTLSVVTSIAEGLRIPVEILFFLGADKNEIVGFDKELAGQMAVAALGLLNEGNVQAA